MKQLHISITGVATAEKHCEFVPGLMIEVAREVATGDQAGVIKVVDLDGNSGDYSWSVREIPTDPLKTAEYMSTAADKLPTGMYLALFHGRKTPNANINGWGTQGPMIPIEGFHTSYKYHMRFRFANEEQAREFAEKTGNGADDAMDEWANARLVDDLLQYDGVFYGDWCVFNHVQAT